MRGAVPALLGEVAAINPGLRSPPEPDAEVSFLGMADVDADRGVTAGGEPRAFREVSKGYTQFLRDDILVAKITPCFENGKIARAGISSRIGVGSTEFHVVRPKPDRLDRQFLVHFLRTDAVRATGALRMTGSAGQRRMPARFLSGLPIALPPLDEQRRIARILDAADHVRAKRREAMVCAARLPYSALIHSSPALTGELVETCPLESLVASGDRINYGVVQPGGQIEGGVPLIRAGDLAGGEVRRDGLKTIDPSVEAAYSRSRIRGNEILLSCVGSVGVVARTTPENIGFNIVRAVARIPIDSQNLRAYVAAYLETPTAQRYFSAELRTVAQPTLNIKQIRALPVPRPTEGWLRRFALRANLIEQTSRRQVVHLAHLDALFASLQSRAFGADLT